MKSGYLCIAGGIFGVVGVLHFVRIALRLPIQIGVLSVPLGLSWVGGVVALLLCAWGIRLAVKKKGIKRP